MKFNLPTFNLSSEAINKITIVFVILLLVLSYFLYENYFKATKKKFDKNPVLDRMETQLEEK